MEPGMIDLQVDQAVSVFVLPAHFLAASSVKRLDQAEMKPRMFVLVLPGLDCALVQVVRPGMIEQAERSDHFAVPSKTEGTADRLNHEQRNLPDLTRPEV